MIRTRRWMFLLCAVALPARANDKVAAELLYEQGKALLKERKYDEACPKFAASNEADPSVGALLHLADCYEKQGKTASAWATFREAASMAAQTRQEERSKVAQSRAEALRPALPRVTITLTGPQPQGLVLRRDGQPMQVALLGSPMPLDPGPHSIEASAPGKKTLSVSFSAKSSEATSVAIPALVDEGGPAPSASAAPLASASAPTAAPVAPPSAAPLASAPPSSEPAVVNRTPAWIAGGVGLVGLGIGSYFGLRAFDRWDQSRAHCEGLRCEPEGASLAREARSSGTVSTIAFTVGGVALAAGAYLYLFPPRSSVQVGAFAAPGAGLISVGGKL